MLILSHRGIEYRPNSLKALNKALTCGFSIETDLRVSKDGKIVIIHDKNLKDNFGIDVNVNELNYKSITNTNSEFVDLIPEFENFIKISVGSLHSKQVIALHIKDHDNTDLIFKTCEVIIKYKLEERVFIFDILLEYVKKVKNYYPKCKIGISVGEKNYSPTIYTVDDIKQYVQFIDIIWADEWKDGLYKKDFFWYCEGIKKDVYVVSPELHKSEEHPFAHKPEMLWKNVSHFIFNGICTDFPEEARNFFESNVKNLKFHDQSNFV